MKTFSFCCFFFNDTAPTEIYTLSLHDALPIWPSRKSAAPRPPISILANDVKSKRSEEHTSELQSLRHLVCRLLLEKKKKQKYNDVRLIHNQYTTQTRRSTPRN